MKDIKFSKFASHKANKSNIIDLGEYVSWVRNGANQDAVLRGRQQKKKGDLEAYRETKLYSMCISAHSVMRSEGTAGKSNIERLNGILLLDIDDPTITDEQIAKVKADRYTLVQHRSFGGVGFCVLVKINSDKFADCFDQLQEYYFTNFGIPIDTACKNENRLRAISYDPEIYVNENASKFNPKAVKKKEFIEPKIIFTNDDFDNILSQIRSRSIDICQDSYDRFMRVGFALYNHFGSSGLPYFIAVCRNGSKFDSAKIERQWKGFSKGCGVGVTIATFYHFCKEENIEIYTPKTKDTIRAVKLYKSQGKVSVETVSKHLTTVNGHEAPDTALIQQLINSKTDYAATLPNEGSKIEQLEKFIIETYRPRKNLFSGDITINENTVINDTISNSIYISSNKFFDDKVRIADVHAILDSTSISSFNPIIDYLTSLEDIPADEAFVDKLIDCILGNNTTEYKRWAFKKFIVGCIHNWISSEHDPVVSPLTLVLTGENQGTGKTFFTRYLIPKCLVKYTADSDPKGKKTDEDVKLCQNIMIYDDDFDTMSMRDVAGYKKYSDNNFIKARTAYARHFKCFKRRAGLIATSNENEILKDPTGNRRILPIHVTSIDFETVSNFDIDEIWRWANQKYKENPHYWRLFSAEDRKYLDENTTNNVAIMPLSEVFLSHFQLQESEEFSERVIMNQGELMTYLLNNTPHKVTTFNVKDICSKLKLMYKLHRINGFEVKKGYELYKKNTNQYSTLGVAPF